MRSEVTSKFIVYGMTDLNSGLWKIVGTDKTFKIYKLIYEDHGRYHLTRVSIFDDCFNFTWKVLGERFMKNAIQYFEPL
jgi:hypothetical protein